ncbi:MAG: hypothetical protein HY653_03610 [Acidobacteria bacterium]|nr:hypothetical protein [Acidobacteriota bacterium]
MAVEPTAVATSTEPASRPGAGRRSEPLSERAPIDNLIRRPVDPEKEAELRGIIRRIGRHLAALPPEQAAAGRIIFPLRRTAMDLYEWEREAFGPSAGGKPAPGVQVVQLSLGLIAWMEEAVVLYQENRSDRYGWKPHFDSLSYAVERTHDQLHTIHGLLLAGGSEEAVQWFAALVNTAQRLVRILDKIAPVFA